MWGPISSIPAGKEHEVDEFLTGLGSRNAWAWRQECPRHKHAQASGFKVIVLLLDIRKL